MNNWKKTTTLFLTSQAITLLGSSIVQFSIIWFVTLKTSSGFWVSMLTVCAYLPQFLISFVSGVWADRYSKKMLIILADGLIAVCTLILALLLPYINNDTILLSLLLLISAIRSIGIGIQTPAVSSLIPILVPEEHLMKVNGVNSTIQSLVQFGAPVIAGALLSISTFRVTLFIDIITAIIGVGILSCTIIPKENVNKENQESVFNDLILGIKYVKENTYILKLLTLNGLFIFFSVPAGFLAALFVTRVYGDNYSYLTMIELVGFAGMMVGGTLISVWGGFKKHMTTLIFGLLLFGVLAILMGVIEIFIVYLILMFIYGIALTMIQTATTTLLQEHSKPEMIGRVFGLFGAIYSGFLPLGMIIFGPLVDIFPIQSVMIVSGIALILLGIIIKQNKELGKY